MIKVTPLKCPSCGAPFSLNLDGRKTITCPYCKSDLLVEDDIIKVSINKNNNIHNRNTDDAKIVEKQVELEKERNRAEENKREQRNSILLIVFLFAAAIIIWLFQEGYIQLDHLFGNRVAVVEVDSHSHYESRDYNSVVAELEGLGFTNIKTVDLNDAGWFKTEDYVSKISINGESSFKSKKYRIDSEIIIMYH